ncbi:MAG: hypothetical protein JRI25_09625 [Deltaproteobacteria bacterium]|nr:hypothetical protein [Deltaproteobacteria bacterium]
MRFAFEETIHHPIDRVYPVLRDRLSEMVPFLESVDSIELLSRTEEADGRLRLLNVWQGNALQAPTVVRPFVTRDLIKWKDHAVWNDPENRVEWRFEAFHLDQLFDAQGANIFTAASDRSTCIEISGSLDVYPERVPGVPRLVARRFGPRIESFVIGLITPNLAQLPGAVEAFLDREDEEVDP